MMSPALPAFTVSGLRIVKVRCTFFLCSDGVRLLVPEIGKQVV
jgi:hypothetical protein